MALIGNLSTLQNLYEIVEIENGYQFVTETNIIYFIVFVSYPVLSDFFPTSIYMLNIDRYIPENVKGHANNVQVRDTIVHILDVFFTAHEEALITICDVVDGKQHARKRLFDKWFDLFNDNRLCRVDAKCMVDDSKTYASLYFLKNSFCVDLLEDEFLKLAEVNFYN